MSKTALFGVDLRVRREATGLSLDEVSHKLRIPSAYLESIETGDFRSLPASCYGLGFLRTYCLYLGLDPEPYLDHYRALGKQAARTVRDASLHSGAAGRPRWMNEAITWAIVCAIFAFGWLSYTVVCRPTSEPSDTRVRAESLDDGMVVPPPVPASLR
ncbi:MAG TPA: helix-turn-helix transcriptional regulator [Candidatus Hydrogenedentes bacterium]|nr:helix-turn-helix transcriptional regulator [Candidatus Hydrogenedentota bacterium]